MARGRRRIMLCSCISILFGAGLSDRVIALFILKVNPATSDATLAFFFAIGPMLAVLTALMSPLIATRGKKRVMVPFYLAGLPFLILLTLLPLARDWFAPGNMVVCVALVLIGYGALRQMGFAGWFPLLNDNIPDNIRGRFFGHLRTSWQLVVVVYTAILGWFLGQSPHPWQFQMIFGFAVVANLAMTVSILRVPEAPLAVQGNGEGFWRMLAVPFRDRSYFNFLAFGVLVNLGISMAGPFALRCLKGTLGAGDNYVVWMDTIASIGAAATLPLWGRMVDRFGGRSIFAIFVPLLSVLNLLWLFVSSGNPHWAWLVAVFYVVQGSLVFGIGVGITDMMMGSAMKGYQSTYVNIAFVLNALASGVGPFLGATVASCGTDWAWGHLVLDANRWVFVARFLILLVPVWMVTRLSREHGGRVGEALQCIATGIQELVPRRK